MPYNIAMAQNDSGDSLIGSCMGRVLAVLLLLIAAPSAAQDGKPQRVVSMNLCTDELLMLLVPPERIVSISWLSHQPESAPPGLELIAADIPSNRGLAEEIIMMQPDLIVAGAFSTRAAVELLRHLGYDVVDFASEDDFADMRVNIRLMGQATGETARAEALVAELDARLAALPGDSSADAPIFADLAANNFVSGEGTLPAAIANAAGYRTLGQALGFAGQRQVSLEQVVLAGPDLVSFGTDYARPPALATQALRHPALRRVAGNAEHVEIPGRLWACGAPGAVRAAELLAATHADARE